MKAAYFIRQSFPTLRWLVVSVDADQAASMRRRGERLYSLRQAHAVARKLNAAAKLAGVQAQILDAARVLGGRPGGLGQEKVALGGSQEAEAASCAAPVTPLRFG